MSYRILNERETMNGQTIGRAFQVLLGAASTRAWTTDTSALTNTERLDHAFEYIVTLGFAERRLLIDIDAAGYDEGVSDAYKANQTYFDAIRRGKPVVYQYRLTVLGEEIAKQVTSGMYQFASDFGLIEVPEVNNVPNP